MLRRPQRTEDRLRAGGEDGAYLCGSLEGWGEQKNCPARSRRKPPWAEARARGGPRPLSSQPQHGERACSGTGRAAQQCTRRARGTECDLAAAHPQRVLKKLPMA